MLPTIADSDTEKHGATASDVARVRALNIPGAGTRRDGFAHLATSTLC